MKNYLIIGASSGIGLQLSNQLKKSSNVYGSFNSNVINDSDIESFKFNVLEDELNIDLLPDELDGVIYCPGSINLKPFKRIKPEDFLKDYELQVVGAIKVLQKTIPLMKNAENPSVILFSTVAVQNGFPFHTQVSASKGSIEGLAKALAAEYAPSLRVNVIAPSLTDTPLAGNLLSSEEKKEANGKRHPLKRIGTTNDIAEIAEFLLSSKASWITGQVLHVDGGMSTLKI